MSFKAEIIVFFGKIFTSDLILKFGADMLHAKRVETRTELLIVGDYSAQVQFYLCLKVSFVKL